MIKFGGLYLVGDTAVDHDVIENGKKLQKTVNPVTKSPAAEGTLG